MPPGISARLTRLVGRRKTEMGLYLVAGIHERILIACQSGFHSPVELRIDILRQPVVQRVERFRELVHRIVLGKAPRG